MEQFYGVFRTYNIAVWPAQWFLVVLGLAAVVLALAPRRGSGVAPSAMGLAGQRPDLVVRFGRGPALPRSLRRPVEAVLV